MTSASERLRALDAGKTFNPMHLWNALPLIADVVEAAEKHVRSEKYVPGAEVRLQSSLTVLRDALEEK